MPVLGLSSMATAELLAELAKDAQRRSLAVRFESRGGVDVVRAIREGTQADLAVLGADAMAELDADGLLVPGTLTPLFVSDVVAAVPSGAGAAPPATEDELRTALLGAQRIAYSTGPSGTALLDLIGRWQLTSALEPKLVRARPGSPVGALLADGHADLGFQQRSELSRLDGVRVLGPLPGAAAVRTVFSGAVLTRAADPAGARLVLDHLGSADAAPVVNAQGMTPA
ncbi:substrate-binding domain-containing protein [Jatrophihabitans endophyticus]|uniref:substrate-binding domain-containing protein n=1 Tax=Jatrophihabitans endophyticus TaxID=1206085 RepID=UPI001A096D7B|nr:substrate-binding domain-containing protein [Jatrophihabitans endophyticus]MBE7188663.1 substrate-binding domain-containing protein [Jatrophihabitans endophyticus]